MAHSVDNFYRIAVQQLPDAELLPLLRRAVVLYADALNAKFSFTLDVQTNELIHAAQIPQISIVEKVKQVHGTGENVLEKFNDGALYLYSRSMSESYAFTVGFEDELSAEAFLMLQDVTSALAIRIKQLTEQTRNVLFQHLIDNSADAIQIARSSGSMLYLNATASRRLGIDRSQVHKHKVLDFQKFFRSQEQWDRHVEDLKLNPSQSFESWHENIITGKRTPVETSIRYIEHGNSGFVLTISRDISARVESQKKLAANEAHLIAVLDSAPESIWSVNENYELLFANRVFIDSFEEVFNVRLEKGMRLIDLVPDEMGHLYRERYDHVLKNNVLQFTESVPSPHGIRRTSVSMSPVVIDDKVVAVSVFGVDTTEQDQNRMVLRQSENRFYKMFTDNTAAMFLIDPETQFFIDVNSASEKLYGWSRTEFLQKKLSDINVVKENVDWEIGKLKEERSGFFVIKHYKKDGTVIDLEVSSCMIVVDNQEIIYQIVHDITERNQYYAAVSEQNKVLKDIAWMQSHVVRAPLARMLGLVDLLEDSDFTELNQTEIVALITESAYELDGIIRTITNQSHEVNQKGNRIKPD
jgi:PAS domain S-box-containing protein